MIQRQIHSDPTWWRRFEAPTWLLVLCVYGGYGLVTWNYQAMPWWLALVLGPWVVCWQGSLQHEVLHGHPTRSRLLNDLIGYPCLWLWLPYPIYRESHLAHHHDHDLTIPGVDPESYYVALDAWLAMTPPRRWLLWFRNSLVGRLLTGPAFAYVELVVGEWRMIAAGDRSHVNHWLVHIPMVAAVLYWAMAVCGIPFWAYVLFFAYPGLSLTMLRSFAEHRPAVAPAARSAVVESGPLFSLLFLNNNLHSAHHADAGLAWYNLPEWYRANRDAFLDANEGHIYSGYREQARRFLLTPKDSPVHPAHQEG